MSKMNMNYNTNIIISADVHIVISRHITRHNSLASMEQEVFRIKTRKVLVS
jgi:hypothetical protein